jgi:excisionase family DNA binding protein
MPIKTSIESCAGGARNKQGTDEQGSSSAIDAKDRSPPISKWSGQTPAITFAASKNDASRSVVRAGPIAADVPAWALQEYGERRTREEIASPVAGKSRSGSPLLGPLMTVGEAATILHVSARTIRRLVERGELHSVRIGRSIRIRVEDIVHIIFGSPND